MCNKCSMLSTSFFPGAQSRTPIRRQSTAVFNTYQAAERWLIKQGRSDDFDCFEDGSRVYKIPHCVTGDEARAVMIDPPTFRTSRVSSVDNKDGVDRNKGNYYDNDGYFQEEGKYGQQADYGVDGGYGTDVSDLGLIEIHRPVPNSIFTDGDVDGRYQDDNYKVNETDDDDAEEGGMIQDESNENHTYILEDDGFDGDGLGHIASPLSSGSRNEDESYERDSLHNADLEVGRSRQDELKFPHIYSHHLDDYGFDDNRQLEASNLISSSDTDGLSMATRSYEHGTDEDEAPTPVRRSSVRFVQAYSPSQDESDMRSEAAEQPCSPNSLHHRLRTPEYSPVDHDEYPNDESSLHWYNHTKHSSSITYMPETPSVPSSSENESDVEPLEYDAVDTCGENKDGYNDLAYSVNVAFTEIPEEDDDGYTHYPTDYNHYQNGPHPGSGEIDNSGRSFRDLETPRCPTSSGNGDGFSDEQDYSHPPTPLERAKSASPKILWPRKTEPCSLSGSRGDLFAPASLEPLSPPMRIPVFADVHRTNTCKRTREKENSPKNKKRPRNAGDDKLHYKNSGKAWETVAIWLMETTELCPEAREMRLKALYEQALDIVNAHGVDIRMMG